MGKIAKYLMIVIASIGIIYLGYQYLITEKYHLKIGNDYEIDLSIKSDETFLDGQYDYKFKFYKNGKSLTKLEVPNCLSRCWVINKSANNPNKLFIYGCHKNKMLKANFEINFTSQIATQVSSVPNSSIILDTLTNLYVDKQLPMKYKY